MNKMTKKLTAGVVAAMMVGTMTASVSFAADNAFGIDEQNWTEDDWNSIAVTNDDTVETGAVIRVSPDSESDAAGFLYRGSAAHVVNKGDEWTEVKSGKVTGYVKNEYLSFGDEARGLAEHYGTPGVAANWNDVNMFTQNDVDSDVSGQVDEGKKMSMLEDHGHWIMVQNGKNSAAYVSEEDVSRVLLMDTAVPASGEDEEDVLADMTVEEASAQLQAASGPQIAEGTAVDGEGNDVSAAAEETATYTEAADGSAYTEEAPAYTEETSTPQTEAAAQASYAEATTADYTLSAASETATSSSSSTQKVSDNEYIQSLYDQYMQVQNTSTDPAAVYDAWNAYLVACGEQPISYATTETQTTTQTQTQTAVQQETQAAVQQETQAQVQQETQAAVQQETQAQVQQETQAAQSSSGSNAYGNYSDLDLLAAIIWCEAGNQSYDGQVAVGQVVMDRVNSSAWPNTVSEVLNQSGQFTPASSGTLQAALANGVNSTCYSAAQDAMNGASPVPGNPTYFNTHDGSYQLGAHYFS